MNTIKIIAIAALAAFINSFVLHEPLLGAITLIKEHNAAQEINEKLGESILPSRYGRVTDGNCRIEDGSKDKRLVVYIQDLHCHPEVQKNISEIIKFFDNEYGVNRIFVEGAPEGKVDIGILSSIPGEELRNKVLTKLLDKGMIGGPEYYAVTNNEDKLYGLEDWEVYKRNLACMQGLVSEKENNKAIADELNAKLKIIKDKHLSPEIKNLFRLPWWERVGERGDNSEKRYIKLEKLGIEINENLNAYPNLSNYIQLIKLKNKINYKRLPGELSQYLAELKKVVPYSVYQTLAKKLEDGKNGEEYYLGLKEIAKNYTPSYEARYSNASKFFNYISLNYSINPVCLVAEEHGFTNRVLTKKARRLVDKEVLFLSDMGRIFKNVSELKVTPGDFEYFKENKDKFRVLLQKYIKYEELVSAINLLDDKDLSEFFETNLNRNNIFIKALIPSSVVTDGHTTSFLSFPGLTGESSVVDIKSLDTPVKPEYDDKNNISARYFKGRGFKIDIAVAGGFHTDIIKTLKSKNIPCLAITPNVTKDYNETIYEKMINGTISAADMEKSALAEALKNIMLEGGIGPEAAENISGLIITDIVLSIEEKGNISADNINSIISAWKEKNPAISTLLSRAKARDVFNGVVITAGSREFEINDKKEVKELINIAAVEDRPQFTGGNADNSSLSLGVILTAVLLIAVFYALAPASNAAPYLAGMMLGTTIGKSNSRRERREAELKGIFILTYKDVSGVLTQLIYLSKNDKRKLITLIKGYKEHYSAVSRKYKKLFPRVPPRGLESLDTDTEFLNRWLIEGESLEKIADSGFITLEEISEALTRIAKLFYYHKYFISLRESSVPYTVRKFVLKQDFPIALGILKDLTSGEKANIVNNFKDLFWDAYILYPDILPLRTKANLEKDREWLRNYNGEDIKPDDSIRTAVFIISHFEPVFSRLIKKKEDGQFDNLHARIIERLAKGFLITDKEKVESIFNKVVFNMIEKQGYNEGRSVFPFDTYKSILSEILSGEDRKKAISEKLGISSAQYSRHLANILKLLAENDIIKSHKDYGLFKNKPDFGWIKANLTPDEKDRLVLGFSDFYINLLINNTALFDGMKSKDVVETLKRNIGFARQFIFENIPESGIALANGLSEGQVREANVRVLLAMAEDPFIKRRLIESETIPVAGKLESLRVRKILSGLSESELDKVIEEYPNICKNLPVKFPYMSLWWEMDGINYKDVIKSLAKKDSEGKLSPIADVAKSCNLNFPKVVDIVRILMFSEIIGQKSEEYIGTEFATDTDKAVYSKKGKRVYRGTAIPPEVWKSNFNGYVKMIVSNRPGLPEARVQFNNNIYRMPYNSKGGVLYAFVRKGEITDFILAQDDGRQYVRLSVNDEKIKINNFLPAWHSVNEGYSLAMIWEMVDLKGAAGDLRKNWSSHNKPSAVRIKNDIESLILKISDEKFEGIVRRVLIELLADKQWLAKFIDLPAKRRRQLVPMQVSHDAEEEAVNKVNTGSIDEILNGEDEADINEILSAREDQANPELPKDPAEIKDYFDAPGKAAMASVVPSKESDMPVENNTLKDNAVTPRFKPGYEIIMIRNVYLGYKKNIELRKTVLRVTGYSPLSDEYTIDLDGESMPVKRKYVEQNFSRNYLNILPPDDTGASIAPITETPFFMLNDNPVIAKEHKLQNPEEENWVSMGLGLIKGTAAIASITASDLTGLNGRKIIDKEGGKYYIKVFFPVKNRLSSVMIEAVKKGVYYESGKNPVIDIDINWDGEKNIIHINYINTEPFGSAGKGLAKEFFNLLSGIAPHGSIITFDTDEKTYQVLSHLSIESGFNEALSMEDLNAQKNKHKYGFRKAVPLSSSPRRGLDAVNSIISPPEDNGIRDENTEPVTVLAGYGGGENPFIIDVNMVSDEGKDIILAAEVRLGRQGAFFVPVDDEKRQGKAYSAAKKIREDIIFNGGSSDLALEFISRSKSTVLKEIAENGLYSGMFMYYFSKNNSANLKLFEKMQMENNIKKSAGTISGRAVMTEQGRSEIGIDTGRDIVEETGLMDEALREKTIIGMFELGQNGKPALWNAITLIEQRDIEGAKNIIGNMSIDKRVRNRIIAKISSAEHEMEKESDPDLIYMYHCQISGILTGMAGLMMRLKMRRKMEIKDSLKFEDILAVLSKRISYEKYSSVSFTKHEKELAAMKPSDSELASNEPWQRYLKLRKLKIKPEQLTRNIDGLINILTRPGSDDKSFSVALMLFLEKFAINREPIFDILERKTEELEPTILKAFSRAG